MQVGNCISFLRLSFCQYYYDIGLYAAHTSWLMTEIPEINPNGNAHDQIQANIYEYVLQGLYEHKQEKEDESN